MIAFKPKNHLSLLCTFCNRKEIDSDKPESGEFYILGGYEIQIYDGKEVYGKWSKIIISKCSECLK